MADDNKNPAGDTERTSILPQSEAQSADQTEILPTHVSQAETAQMPPVTQEDTDNAFAGTPLESVAGSSADDGLDTTVTTVRAIDPQSGTITATRTFTFPSEYLSAPERSKALAITSSASVESRPPESPTVALWQWI